MLYHSHIISLRGRGGNESKCVGDDYIRKVGRDDQRRAIEKLEGESSDGQKMVKYGLGGTEGVENPKDDK